MLGTYSGVTAHVFVIPAKNQVRIVTYSQYSPKRPISNIATF
jgi:hypothetical protein